jgi:hypothetical protein
MEQFWGRAVRRASHDLTESGAFCFVACRSTRLYSHLKCSGPGFAFILLVGLGGLFCAAGIVVYLYSLVSADDVGRRPSR